MPTVAGWAQAPGAQHPGDRSPSTWLDTDPASNGPAPTLASIAPATVARGAAPVTVVLTGTGFTPNVVATFNGVDQPTTYISDTSASFRVDASGRDFTAQAGAYPVNVRTPGGTTATPRTFTIT